MNDVSPAGRGSRRRPGGMHNEGSGDPRTTLHRLEVQARLAAIVDELRLLDTDRMDVPLTLAEGLLEDIEAAL